MNTEVDALIENAKREPALASSVERIRGFRYSASREDFDELLWLVVAQAIATGRSIGMNAAHKIFSEVLAKPAEAPKS